MEQEIIFRKSQLVSGVLQMKRDRVHPSLGAVH